MQSSRLSRAPQKVFDDSPDDSWILSYCIGHGYSSILRFDTWLLIANCEAKKGSPPLLGPVNFIHLSGNGLATVKLSAVKNFSDNQHNVTALMMDFIWIKRQFCRSLRATVKQVNSWCIGRTFTVCNHPDYPKHYRKPAFQWQSKWQNCRLQNLSDNHQNESVRRKERRLPIQVPLA